MKILIITIIDTNYGNRLQNFAIHYVLKKMNLDVVSLNTSNSKKKCEQFIKYVMQYIFAFKLPGDHLFWKYNIPQKSLFDKFNKKYIDFLNIRFLEKSLTQYDFFVIGSDQVWNPTWYKDDTIRKNIFFLTFAKPNQKICFSPSFGIEQLPDNWKPWFKEKLALFPRFSVREESGAKIIKELTGKDAEILIDPTLMLDAEEWLHIANAPKNVDCSLKYILTYFLGEQSENTKAMIKNIAEQYNLKIRKLLDYENINIFISGPSEFIYLLANASLIMTDSFHACVFSFLFKKPFLVFAREGKENNMISRIDTLLEKFNLKRKYVGSGLKNEIFECDYDEGFNQLEKEREKVIKFLKESMSLE